MADDLTTVSYEVRGAAADLWKYKGPEVVISGPAGTGKTIACLLRLHLLCLNNPGLRALIVRKTGVSLTSTTLVSFRKKVLPEAVKGGLVRWYGGSQQEAAGYKYANGSEIDICGLDKPEKILSSEYDIIFADECTELSVDDWEFARSRLRNGILDWQQLMGACNPDAPSHWLKFREITGQVVILISRHQDNPAYALRSGTWTTLGKAYVEGILEGLTGVRRLRLRDGIWAAAEGIIYTQYDERIHRIPGFPIPDDWRRYWVIDFGFNNPFVCSQWAEDGDGSIYLYRELYVTKKTVEQCAFELMRYSRDKNGTWKEPKPYQVICDHDSENRETFTQKTGLSTRAADKRVILGIQTVQTWLKNNKIFLLTDALLYHDKELVERKKPTQTSEEFGNYIWAKRKRKDGAIDEKDEPEKEFDHGMDALRYLVMALDHHVPANVRWM